MHLTVYADVLFLTNFLANLFLLCLTKRIIKNKSCIFRQLAGAGIGSLYAILLFFQEFSTLCSTALLLTGALVMLLISFRFYSIKQFLQCSIVFLTATLLSGGLCYALFFTTSLGMQTGAILKNGVFYWHVPLYTIPIAFLLAHGLCIVFGQLISFFTVRRQSLHTLSVQYGSKHVELHALLDTGNALYDPLSALPVIVAEAKEVLPLLDERTQMHTLHQIPYRTLAGESHLMPAIKPDCIKIDVQTANDCMLALTETQLCFDGQYRALLHSAAFQGGNHEHQTKVFASRQR